MDDAVNSAIDLLTKRHLELEGSRNELRQRVRDVELELGRIDSALRSLRGSSPSPKRTGTRRAPSGRGPSARDLVLETLAQRGPSTPSEVAGALVDAGKLDLGRDGSIRTALWQLRKDGDVVTDDAGRSSLATSRNGGPS